MNSFIGWVGAKTKMAAEISSKFPPHTGYCEVFGGGGSLLFYKEKSKAEIYNDVNSELVNLFHVVRDDVNSLEHLIRWTLSSREDFDYYTSMDKDLISTLTPVERAFRYYYIIKNSFGQNPTAGSFSSCSTTPIRWNPYIDLPPHKDRLSKVTIENLDFRKLIPKYDTPTMLFYADPPYYVAEGKSYYEFDFKQKDHEDLRDTLKDIEGKFIVSYDDVPEVHELYSNFYITKSKPITYTLSSGSNHAKEELLIYNYDPKKAGSQMRLNLL